VAIEANQGIEMAIEYQLDLILLDINLPGKNGFAVMEELGNDKRTKAIPVMGLSANARREDIAKGLSLGFAGYITKPIDIPQFLEQIDSFFCFSS
jgi:CheY-like chemotaxis protein